VRCFGDGNELYAAYHDEEWGRPVVDERGLYERLCLESFQSGLSWLIILRKRPGFRAAFADFDPEVVATFDGRDVERLLQDAGIVRNQAKIEATIANARATLALRDGPRDLAQLVWDHRPDRPLGHPAPAGLRDMPAHVPESAALAKALKREGFRFLGPTTLYAGMQACGLVNDHLRECPVRDAVAAAQAAATRPG
jgi:DNA-3-methyladenine glycosylase I